MAYTFYKALGYEVGTSKCENDFVEFAKGLLEKANGKIILPIDTIVVKDLVNLLKVVVLSDQIPAMKWVWILVQRQLNYLKRIARSKSDCLEWSRSI